MPINHEAVGKSIEKFERGKGKRLTFTSVDKAHGSYYVDGIEEVPLAQAKDTVCALCSPW